MPFQSPETDRIQRAIQALEDQRALIGDSVVDLAVAPLRQRLESLETPPRTEPVQTLKQVSVLFLDVVGSTTLSQHLDPEEISIVIDGALARCTQAVQTQGGKVLQYAGDSLLAAFGADEAREDDAERAVRAGLALLTLGRQLGDEVRARHGHDGLDVRVGIHTGAVLLGGGVDQDSTIRGITVNIAARMEQTAPAGALRISHDTYRLVAGVFDVQPQALLAIKGVDAPVTSYLVQAAKPRALALGSWGTGEAPTALVGREAELGQLDAAFQRVLAGGGLQAVTLLGDPGLGKSRLMHELLQRVELHEQDCWLLPARCPPGGALQPFGLLRTLLTFRLDIADSDDVDTARAKLVDGLMPRMRAAGADEAAAAIEARCLGHLIGFDFSTEPTLAELLAEPPLLRERAQAAMLRFLSGLANDGSPLIMVLEDLHWADQASLDWLQSLLTARGTLALLLVMTTRPTLLERRPAWQEVLTGHRCLTLAPLGPAARRQLTETLLLPLAGAPDTLCALIDRRAEGNPFYAEELVRMLRDRHVIVDDPANPGHWQLAGEPFLNDLPVTLTGVLQARLDMLSPTERHALQLASVIGAVFWDEALAALDPQAVAMLATLQRRSLIHTHPHSRLEGCTERSFHHHLLHQVTYDTVLKSVRQQGHARAATWLQAHTAERSDEMQATTAEHFERAGQHGQAEAGFIRAAETADRRDAVHASIDFYRRALALPDAGDPRARVRARIRIADHQEHLADYAAAKATLALAVEEAQHIGAPDLRVDAMTSQALLAERVGDGALAWTLSLDVAREAEAADLALAAALGHGNLSWLSKERGDFDAALEHSQRGLHWARLYRARHAEELDAHRFEVQLLMNQAAIHCDAYDDDRCAELLEEIRPLAASLERARTRGHYFLDQSELALRRADPNAAATQLMALEALGPGAGAYLEVIRLHAWAQLHALQGQWQASLDLAETTARRFAELDVQLRSAEARLMAVRALLELGRHDEALRACEACDPGNDVATTRCRALLQALALQRAGDGDVALACVREQLEANNVATSLDPHPLALVARWAACQVLAAHRDPAERHQLALVWSELQRWIGRSSDPATQARVRDLPLHREIAAAWHARQSSDAPFTDETPP